MDEIERTRRVAAPVDEVWDVLADFGGIASWADAVDHSCLMSVPGGAAFAPGDARRVQAGRITVVERIVVWDPPRELSYDLEGLPAVVRAARNTWLLRPDGLATEVALRSRVISGPRPPHRVAERVITRVLARTSDRLLDSLAAAVTRGAATPEAVR